MRRLTKCYYKKMSKKRELIPVFRPNYGAEEIKAATEVLKSGWIGLGKLSPDFIQRCLWPMLAIGIIGTACLNLTSTIIPMSLIFVLTGFTATVTGIGAQTLIQLKVEEDYRARVMTWWSSVSFGSLTVGGILIGFFGDLMPIGDGILMVMIPGGLLAIFVLVKLPLSRWAV